MSKDAAKLLANLAIMQSKTRRDAQDILLQALFDLAGLETPTTPPATKRVGKQEQLEMDFTQPKKAPEITVNESVAQTKKQLLVKSGGSCVCSNCGDLYTINKDIYDGITAIAFAACFQPISAKVPALEPPLAYHAINDGVLMDCPVCKGDMTLLLWGSRPRLNERNVSSDATAVRSLGYEDIQGV